MGRSIPAIKDVFGPLETAAIDIGLRVNEDKTKLMLQSRRQRRRIGQNITIEDHNFEVVNNFTYLGSNITNENEEVQEIHKRIAAANRTYFSLLPIMKSKNVHRKTKIRLYKTLIRTVISYGGEAWTMSSKTSEMLDIVERRMLRRIYGPVNDRGTWRIRYNLELYELYKEPRLSIFIKMLRLRWAGHVERMPDTRVPKRAMDGEPGGRRPVGKPRLRWVDNIGKDAAELLGVKNWKRTARERDVWRQKIEEAKARFGL